MVLYRKYRPQRLDDLIGQDSVKTTLLNAFINEKLAHAYLFCGPRGSGKTSTARILAKMVNCAIEDKTQAPCNKCESCISITDGSNLDLIEIDAASNRGIDDIRDLRERVKLAPTQAKLKVYIIDEVHMLTTEAFNALLKTLEEPPAHVLFILATTEAHKIPQTILSRVQKLDFKLAKIEDLLTYLKKIAGEEKIDIDDDALRLVAKRGEGSFRDALKFLDQLSSVGGKITLEVAEKSLSHGKFEDITDLIKTLISKDSQKALSLVLKQNEEGVNIKEFHTELLDTLRSILFINNGAEAPIHEYLGSGKFESIKELSNNVSNIRLIRFFDVLQKAGEQMKTTSIASLPLEVAVVECCMEQSQVTEIRSEHQEIMDSPQRPSEEKTVKKEEPTPAYKATPNSPDVLTIKDKWTYILETVKPYNYSLEALLKQAKIHSCDEGVFTLEVPYTFHQRILDAPKSRTLLESVLADVLGKPMKVSTILGKRPVRIEEIDNIEVAADDEIIQIAAEIFNS